LAKAGRPQLTWDQRIEEHERCAEIIADDAPWLWIAQPGFEQFGVGDGRFPESQPCPDLGPMTLPGPACRVVPIAIIEFRTKLSSHSRHSSIIDFYWLLGKPPIRPVKQEQHSEA